MARSVTASLQLLAELAVLDYAGDVAQVGHDLGEPLHSVVARTGLGEVDVEQVAAGQLGEGDAGGVGAGEGLADVGGGAYEAPGDRFACPRGLGLVAVAASGAPSAPSVRAYTVATPDFAGDGVVEAGFPIVWLPSRVPGFRLVLARDWHDQRAAPPQPSDYKENCQVHTNPSQAT
jgi:hypothetical protein